MIMKLCCLGHELLKSTIEPTTKPLPILGALLLQYKHMCNIYIIYCTIYSWEGFELVNNCIQLHVSAE